MQAFKVITDPKAFEIMADDTRRRIIHLLRARELTVSQIAENLNKTPQAIYHQIRKMLEAGLVEVAKEERVDHFIETYYRATAEVFNFSHGQGNSQGVMEQRLKESLQHIGNLGLKVKFDEATINKLVELFSNEDKEALDPKLLEKIQKLEGVDLITKQSIAHIANLLTMSDYHFNSMLSKQRELRELLVSSLLEKIPAAAKHPKSKAH